MFSSAIPALAMSVGDKDSVKVKYLNAYYNVGRFETANGEVHTANGQVGMRTLKNEGTPVYCLQIYEASNNNTVTGGNIKDCAVWNNEFSLDAQRNVPRVLIWGYPNYTYGYSKEAAYLATQALIWEFETGHRTNFNSYGNSWVYNMFKNVSGSEACYKAIIDACYNHGTRPNFGTTSIELKGVGSSNKVSLADKNSVLGQFNVSCNNSNISVSKNGNNLEIYAKTGGNISGTITLTKNKTDINSALSLTGANQTMIYGTLADPVKLDLTVKLSNGNLTITKTSEDGIKQGFTFNVKGNGIDKDYTTDANGKISLTDIPSGDYTVTEKLNGTQGHYAVQSSQNVTVSAGATANVNVHNTYKRGTVQVTKYDAHTDKPITVTDGVFKVQQWSSTENTYVDYKDLTYNKEIGKYEATNLVCTPDNNSMFRVVEVKAPTGYFIVGKGYWDFTINTDKQVCDINGGKVLNMAQTARIKIVKTDKETGLPLNGVTFDIVAKNDIYHNGELQYKKGEVVDTITTKEQVFPKEQGVAYSMPLFLGEYYVIEKQAAPGYVLDESKHLVSLTFDDQLAMIYTSSIDLTNERQMAMIELLKKDKVTGVELEGAVYELRAAEDIVIGNKTVYKKGDLVQTLTTAKGGTISNALYLGKYTLKEVAAPEGFLLDKNTYDVNLEYKDQLINVYVETVTYLDAPQMANVSILKTDRETKSPLANAVYDIVAAEDIVLCGEVLYPAGTVIETLTTDENGKALSQPMYLGKYYAVETKAPEGYVVDNTHYDFELKYQGQYTELFTKELEFGNGAQMAKLHITKTGEVLDYFDFMMTEFGMKYGPLYTEKSLAGSVWEITALEDVIVNGDVKYHEGDIVEYLTTDENGATSKALYLGKYRVKEITATEGFFIGANEFEVELKYKGQDTDVYTVELEAFNERQKVKVTLNKTFEENEYYPNAEAYQDVVFGVFAAEDIKVNGEVVLEKDMMVDCFGVDDQGLGMTTVDLPVGYKWYAKEIKTAEGYVLNDTKYEFEFGPQAQEIPLLWVDLNEDGTVIENKVIRGSIEGLKIDNNNKPVEGAVFGLFMADATEFTKENALALSTSDKHGKFGFDNLPYGKYIIKELSCPEGYIMNEELCPVEINENGMIIELTVMNEKITVEVEIPDTGALSAPQAMTMTAAFSIFFSALAFAVVMFKRKKQFD